MHVFFFSIWFCLVGRFWMGSITVSLFIPHSIHVWSSLIFRLSFRFPSRWSVVQMTSNVWKNGPWKVCFAWNARESLIGWHRHLCCFFFVLFLLLGVLMRSTDAVVVDDDVVVGLTLIVLVIVVGSCRMSLKSVVSGNEDSSQWGADCRGAMLLSTVILSEQRCARSARWYS